MHAFLTRPLMAALWGAAVFGATAALAQGAALNVGPNAAQAGEREGFYRFPALRGQTLVFTAESDLWRVGLQGGRAERITSHPELEARAALSPDGRTLAFVGAYEGVSEVYTLPLAGGVPQRLTWQGQNPRVWGHTPAGEVLVTAPAQRGEPVTQLYAIDPRTQAQRVLPVGQASDGALSADGHILYFTRLGLLSDNVRAYRGGGMAQLWRLDLRGQAEAQPLLPAPAAGARPAGNDQRPMPYRGSGGERIAFLSDRDGQFNLYSVNAQGGDLQQHTRHRGWDIRHAAIDGTRVVYALGADLRLVDLETGQDQRLAITLGGDADALRARWVQRPQGFFDGARVSSDGQRALLNVRGRLATQGTGTLRRAELPVPADARCREGVFSHDGRHVYALCDIAPAPVAAGAPPAELEVWRFNADGSGAPLQITRGATMRRLALFPSPDGRWLAHTDKNGQLLLTALTPTGAGATRAVELPGPARSAPAQLVWAPDSQSFVFTRGGADANRARLFLHHLAQARTAPLTSDRYSSGAPAYTPDGRWLYFLSDRHFASLNAGPWGDRNLGPYFDRRSKVYALALQAGGPRFPFQPRDELQPESEGAAAAPAGPAAPAAAASGSAGATTAGTPPARSGAAGAGRAAGAAPPPIELAGLAERLHEVPLPPGNYTRLHTDGKRLYFLEADSTVERRTSLRTLAIENTGPQPELFAADVNEFELSADAKRLLLVRRAATPQQAADIQLMDAAAKAPTEAAVLARTQVRWADWQMQTEPAAEWRQLFEDAWRLHRDHFYDARMHGTDWPAVRRKYAALLPRVGERRDLAELMAQMVAEVGALHSQVAAGDVRRGPDDIAAAGLGARFSKVAQGFRVEQLYRSDPELPTEAGPLVQAGVKVGETLTTLNGRSLAGVAALPELLRGQVGRQVLLTVKPEGAGAERRVVVLPVNAEREAALREGDWEQGRLQRAAERSQGRVGYLRLRAMGRGDIATFAREFYAQLDREALIIDVRRNTGGNIDSWVLTQLLRRAWAWWQPRSPEGAESNPNMQQSYRGRMAVLIDANTYSDGETFAEGFKRLQLGTLIGRRTAGAGIWLSDGNRLLDRGIMRAAETGQYALDGGWLIEGRGVTPDIDVDNPPRSTHEGGDAQLDAAVSHLLRQLAEQPLPRPVAPPYQRP